MERDREGMSATIDESEASLTNNTGFSIQENRGVCPAYELVGGCAGEKVLVLLRAVDRFDWHIGSSL